MENEPSKNELFECEEATLPSKKMKYTLPFRYFSDLQPL